MWYTGAMVSRTPPPTARRAYVRVVVWLVALIVLAGLAAWFAMRVQRQLASYSDVSSSIPRAADKSYGVTADLSGLTGTELEDALRRMKGLGLRWLRQPFPWAEIEPVRGKFRWEAWDRVVAAARAHDLDVITVLDTAPVWARPPESSLHTPPTELSDFGAFARAVAQRYGDRLDVYQVWDEPNLSAHWGDRYVEPRAYAHLLREAAINVRAADSDAIILTAALAPTLERGPLNLNEMDFLARLYAANAGEWFDVLAAQPYGFRAAPEEPPAVGSLDFTRATLLRRVMTAHGDAGKPIWITGFGWSALPPEWDGAPSPWPAVSSEDQERYTAQAISFARSDWPWLGPMLFSAWDAGLLPADDPRRGLALVDGETDLPPAAGLRQAEPHDDIATVGTYPAAHPSGHYTGAWRLTPDGADVPREPPASFVVRFEGTRLDLLVRRGEFKGFLYVTVDGQPANWLPEQDGHAYLLLYDPLEEPAEVTVARYLPDGRHTAVIEAEGGWYQWPLVGWRVVREADVRLLTAGLALAGLLALAALGGLLRTALSLPLRAWVRWLSAHYLALGTPAHASLLVVAASAFYFAPGSLPSLALLGLLFLCVLPRPDLTLALVAFSLPFFLLPKSLVGRTISMTEVLLILVAVALVTRRTLRLSDVVDVPGVPPAGTRPPVGPCWLDGAAWALTALGLLSALPAVLPLSGAAWM